MHKEAQATASVRQQSDLRDEASCDHLYSGPAASHNLNGTGFDPIDNRSGNIRKIAQRASMHE